MAAVVARPARVFGSGPGQQLQEGRGLLGAGPAAGEVRAPTLVLHARDDRRPPFAQGRLTASLIQGSRFVALDSCNHILLADEPAWPVFLREVEAFLAA